MSNDNSDSAPPPAPASRKSSEPADAIRIAHRWLDQPGIDPDGDECVMARQLLRSCERELIRQKMIESMAHIIAGMLGDLPPELQDHPNVVRARDFMARILERR